MRSYQTHTFYNIAEETGRKLLIGIRAARYLEALKLADPNLNISDIDDHKVGIYKQRELRYGSDDKDFYEKHNTNVWSSTDVKQKEAHVITSMSSYTAGMIKAIFTLTAIRSLRNHDYNFRIRTREEDTCSCRDGVIYLNGDDFDD